MLASTVARFRLAFVMKERLTKPQENYTYRSSLRKHPFLLPLRRQGRFARPPRETSLAAKSEEKRLKTGKNIIIQS